MVSRLTEVYGKEVYTVEGMHVGSLEDVSVEPESGRLGGLIISNVDRAFQGRLGIEGKKGFILPYSGVKAVGDIVLIGNIRYESESTETVQ
ncbi:MAG: PRC-barrel domain-containing protein [Candidatus Hydrothermarchaeales archaeon]